MMGRELVVRVAPEATALELVALYRRLEVLFRQEHDAAREVLYVEDLMRRSVTLVDATKGVEWCQAEMTHFPTLAEWLDGCEEPASTQPQPTRIWEPPAPTYECRICEDTGFERHLLCPGDGTCRLAKCGESGHDSYPHGFTRVCGCRATNNAFQRTHPLGKKEYRAKSTRGRKSFWQR